jgi:hypothetical protein
MAPSGLAVKPWGSELNHGTTAPRRGAIGSSRALWPPRQGGDRRWDIRIKGAEKMVIPWPE